MQADQRAGQDRRADEQAELRFREAEALLDLKTDDRDNRLDVKADREYDCREPEHPALLRWRDRCADHGSFYKFASNRERIAELRKSLSLTQIKRFLAESNFNHTKPLAEISIRFF